MVTTRSIPLARPHIGERERELVMDVLRSDTLACGEMVPAFERRFAEQVGTRFAVACSSGTAGLHVALDRLGLGPGDEVITSSFSFIASANVILHERATPVFADIDEDTLNVDPAAIEAAITPRTRAIVPIHIFGYPCDIEAIAGIAAEHGIPVVEDACEALGCTVNGRPVGSHGNPAVYGFYPNKQLTTGEGGMVTTDDEAVAADLRSLVNQGRSDNGDWLVHQRVGFNYRMDEMSAAIGSTCPTAAPRCAAGSSTTSASPTASTATPSRPGSRPAGSPPARTCRRSISSRRTVTASGTPRGCCP
jgi:perosamine synthetase